MTDCSGVACSQASMATGGEHTLVPVVVFILLSLACPRVRCNSAPVPPVWVQQNLTTAALIALGVSPTGLTAPALTSGVAVGYVSSALTPSQMTDFIVAHSARRGDAGAGNGAPRVPPC